MARRPHIIIFNPDEMRWDTMAHMGNPAAVTPNLDAFAKEDAVSYSRAYCQNPVCVPSRCSFFTGLYPHVRGHRTMEHLLRPGEFTLFSALKANGYHVWMNARNDLLAGQIPGWADSHADEIFYGRERSSRGAPVKGDVRGEPGQKYYYSHFKGQLQTDADGRCYTNDDATVDAAIDRLLHPVDDKPMCLFLGLNYPHVPYGVEEPYFSAIDRSKVPPRVKLEDCTGKSRMVHLLHKYVAMDDFTEEEWTELRAVYLAMCTKIDDQFGRLVKALKDAGIYDDCAIFFFSDHGDWAGDFGLPEKAQSAFEDCVTRVPLLVKPPKDIPCEPGISDQIVELVDFYATALDFAQTPSQHVQFGRSLRENLADHSVQIRKFACCEGGRIPEETHADEYHAGKFGGNTTAEYWPKKMAQSDDAAHAKGFMMRADRYKYISRVSGEDELYDMVEDPHEMHNRIDDPALASVLLDMKMDMLKWLQYTSDIVPYEFDARWTPTMILEKIRRMVPPEQFVIAEKLVAEGRQLPEIMGILHGGKH